MSENRKWLIAIAVIWLGGGGIWTLLTGVHDATSFACTDWSIVAGRSGPTCQQTMPDTYHAAWDIHAKPPLDILSERTPQQ